MNEIALTSGEYEGMPPTFPIIGGRGMKEIVCMFRSVI
jgi:hypothetical protein